MPVGAARVGRSGPVRRLGVPDLEPQPPVVGPLHSEPRQHPGPDPETARRWRRRASAVTPLLGRSRSLAKAVRSATVDFAPKPVASRRPPARNGHPERLETASAGYWPTRWKRLVRSSREHLKSVVGEDPALARFGHQLRRLHGVTRRVREQVPDRGTRRTGLGVEFDDASSIAIVRHGRRAAW